MKTINNTSIKYTLTVLAILYTGLAFGQEENPLLPKKLDFLITAIKSDSVTRDGSILFDLHMEIERNEIIKQEKVYVKIISKNPREIYFIRAIDSEVLTGKKDVKEWEKEQAEKENERAEVRSKIKSKKKNAEERKKPRYEKQNGRELKALDTKAGKTSMKFGPFSPGDYIVFVRIMDENDNLFEDQHDITISSEIEPTE